MDIFGIIPIWAIFASPKPEKPLFSSVAQHPCGYRQADHCNSYAPDKCEPCWISHFGSDQPRPHGVDYMGYRLIFSEYSESIWHGFGGHEGARDEREGKNDDESYPLRAFQTFYQKPQYSREPGYGESEKQGENGDCKPFSDTCRRSKSDQKPDYDDNHTRSDISHQISRNMSDEKRARGHRQGFESIDNPLFHIYSYIDGRIIRTERQGLDENPREKKVRIGDIAGIYGPSEHVSVQEHEHYRKHRHRHELIEAASNMTHASLHHHPGIAHPIDQRMVSGYCFSWMGSCHMHVD